MPDHPIDQFTGRYRFLSNFYLCPTWYGGKSYRTVEHAFQAAKTLDPNIQERIKKAVSPGQAKSMGGNIKLRPGWDAIKIDIMRELLIFKFHPYLLPRMSAKLVETEDRKLLEGNTWGDTFWGVDSISGAGQNNLGKLLMEVRSLVRGIPSART